MTSKKGHPSDEIWSAPESGTVRDDTSGNGPSAREDDILVEAAAGRYGSRPGDAREKDDPAVAPEER